MKTKSQTLNDIVAYVMNNAESTTDAIDELLTMGFDAYQLVSVYNLNPDDIRKSEVYKNSDDDIDNYTYPFVLEKYTPLDASILSKLAFTSESTDDEIKNIEEKFKTFKESEIYKRICEDYEELQTEINDNASIVIDELDDSLMNNICNFFETNDSAWLEKDW